MILTLAVNAVLLGLAVVYTGGFAPQTKASPLMRWLGREQFAAGHTERAVGVARARRCSSCCCCGGRAFGRAIFADRQSRARQLSVGHPDTGRVICTAFVFGGFTSALGGVLLAGRFDQSYQGMGNDYLLPAIAAVVIGGTHILGGRGTYLGTVAGVARHHASVERARGDADAGGEPTDHLRRGDHRDAAAYCREAKGVTP